MNFSINNQHHSSFAYSASGNTVGSKVARRPLIIEGEKISSYSNAPSKSSTATKQTHNASYANSAAQERIVEARPVKDSEQLFGSRSVLSARTPMATFAYISQPTLNLGASLGSSVDTYA